ncbi:hypothetical protein JOC85_001277 [Bacillus mesophilus]|uniref:Uncharacterized protein n=1 Tax=Bacillus mesophilus TaxID=1808955 RepID=A0A6M0Q6I6_9BACI|nr:hypothetical protein [Bacillus mesophilus]MBM7660505.1 hypothetical protein [Bacillus mesophilus]NEY71945.1 hypothetical protein [Bacillus mesophilus]
MKVLTIYLIFVLALTIMGFFLGMNVGGNHFEDFIFNGARGYELGGQVGGLLGLTVGLSLIIVHLLLKKFRKD